MQKAIFSGRCKNCERDFKVQLESSDPNRLTGREVAAALWRKSDLKQNVSPDGALTFNIIDMAILNACSTGYMHTFPLDAFVQVET